MVNGPLQKQRWVFFNHNHCLSRVCTFLFVNNTIAEVYKRIYMYEYTYKHPSSSTAADPWQHASPQQVGHTLGYIRVFHLRRKRARVRARDSDIVNCHACDSPSCRLSRQPAYNWSLQNWRKRFRRISLMRVWRFEM